MDGLTISRRTVTRHLAVLGLNHRRFIDPDGENSRKPQKFVAKRPGHMVRIEREEGRTHPRRRRLAHPRQEQRPRPTGCAPQRQVGARRYVYLHSAIDGYSRPRLHRGPGRHQRITPYTPRHNGKVERHNRIISEEFLYARTWISEDQRREALGVWNVHYNYHRPHSAADGEPPASLLPTGVSNVLASYS